MTMVNCSSCGQDFERWHERRLQCRTCFNKRAVEYAHKHIEKTNASKAKALEKAAEERKLILASNKLIECMICLQQRRVTWFRVGRNICRECANKQTRDRKRDVRKQERGDQCQAIIRYGKNKGKRCSTLSIYEGKWCGIHRPLVVVKTDEETDVDSKETNKKSEKDPAIQIPCNELKTPEDRSEIVLRNSNLILNNIKVEYRSSDGKVNLTQLFHAGNKEYKAWFRNKKTKEYLDAFSSAVKVCTADLLVYENRGSENRATWSHPQIAINAAQWISPVFNVQVSKWVYELALTGSVTLGHEKKQEELDSAWKEKCEKLKTENNKLTENNNKLYRKVSNLTCTLNKIRKMHHYVGFNINGPCYYVYTVVDLQTGEHAKTRIGIAGTKNVAVLDDRLRTHRGDDVNMHLEMVISSSLASIERLEENIKYIYRDYLAAPNHEVLSANVDVGELLDRVKRTISVLCIDKSEYSFIPEDKLREYNEDVQTTLIKPKPQLKLTLD